MTNKILIPIRVIIIIAIGIGACFIFQNPAFAQPQKNKGGFIKDLDKDGDGKVSREEFPGPDDVFKRFDRDGDGFISSEEAPRESARKITFSQPQTGKCGDGVCGEVEKSNPNLCPKDCQQTASTPTPIPTLKPTSTPTPKPTLTLSEADLLYSFYAGFDAMSLSSSDLGKVFKIAREDLGLNYLKVNFNWGNIQKEKEKFDWSKIDPVAALAGKYNLSIIVFIHQQGTPSWAQKIPSTINNYNCPVSTLITKEPDYYANFIYEFIKRYKDKMSIKYLELENEPNALCLWPNTGKYLAEVDNAVYEKVKSNYPDINIWSASFHQPLGLGGADIKEENEYTETFLKDYLSNLKKIDGFSLHDYGLTGFTQTNEYKFSTQYDLEDNYRKILDESGFQNTPIIFTECAYGKALFRNDENLAAAALVQGYVLTHAKGIAKGRMCQAISPGILGQQGGENYGITNVATGKYYAGYYVFKTLRSLMLNYSSYVGHIKGEINDKNYWIEKFKDGKGNELYVVFAPILFEGEPPSMKPQPSASQTATINIGAGKTATVTKMKGEQSALKTDNSGNITLTVNVEPIFIEVSID